MKVIIFGSHKVAALEGPVTEKIDSVLIKGGEILVGDHSGLDSEVQRYLSGRGAKSARVYTARQTPARNLGPWPVVHPPPDGRFAALSHNLRCNLSMAQRADHGIALWDGDSAGTYLMTAALIEGRKAVWVYLTKTGEGLFLRGPGDLEDLLKTRIYI